jgi:hypothetical protein
MADQQTDALAEIKAMQGVAEALEVVDEGARLRVLDWANDRYGGRAVRNAKRHEALVDEDDSEFQVPQNGTRGAEYETSGELLAASRARSEPERVLVMGYWFQVINGQADLESQEISTELKHLGHKVSNTTRAFSTLMNQRPQLVIQMRKGGNTKQARKKYKLTAEGIAAVTRMLRGENGTDD